MKGRQTAARVGGIWLSLSSPGSRQLPGPTTSNRFLRPAALVEFFTRFAASANLKAWIDLKLRQVRRSRREVMGSRGKRTSAAEGGLCSTKIRWP